MFPRFTLRMGVAAAVACAALTATKTAEAQCSGYSAPPVYRAPTYAVQPTYTIANPYYPTTYAPPSYGTTYYSRPSVVYSSSPRIYGSRVISSRGSCGTPVRTYYAPSTRYYSPSVRYYPSTVRYYSPSIRYAPSCGSSGFSFSYHRR